MNCEKRINRLGFFFIFLGVLIAATLCFRMIHQQKALVSKLFFDRPMQELIVRLAGEGVIKPSVDGVVIDPESLRSRVASPSARHFILARMPYMSFNGGSFSLDESALRVTNRRVIRDAMRRSRGRILDRFGKVLAYNERLADRRFVRKYPMGESTLPVVGIAHAVYGTKGLERMLSPYLEGFAGEGGFRWLYRFLSGKEKYYDVELTIDAALQETAFKALEGKTGAVAVVDVETGEILAAASRPSFDPTHPPGRVWDDAAGKGYKGPFVNRALQRRYPPGSTFKLITAAAWMEHSDFDPKWGLNCRGRHPRYNIREYRGKSHGWVGLKNALTHSCNVFFAEAGVRLGPALADRAERFGFNRNWSLLEDLPSKEMIAPSRAFRGHPGIRGGGAWKPIDFKRNPKLVAQAAIGQNVVDVTPLQMAMAAAAIANGGEFMAPRLIRGVRYVNENHTVSDTWFSFETTKPKLFKRVCSKDTANALMQMMAEVVNIGTGHRLKKIYVKDGRYRTGRRIPAGAENVLTGKTGTAETLKGRPDHAWFVAVAPLKAPRYAVSVIVEYGGLGGKTAGPIAVKIMTAALNRNNPESGKQI